MNHFVLSSIALCSLSSLFTPALRDGLAEEVVLSPIVVQGNPLDLFSDDTEKSLQTFSSRAQRSQGVTGAQRVEGGPLSTQLKRNLGLPISDSGQPGATAQVRGVGFSAEETQVDSLGVPLTPVQGGGFDFSLFPEFLWGDVLYGTGPQATVSDPRAVAGRLSLVPITSSSLENRQSHAWFGQSYSSAVLSQTWVGAKFEDRFAATAGWSDGKVSGPSGAFSTKSIIAEGSSQIEWVVNGLGSSMTSELDGTISYPTPGATQKTRRGILSTQATRWLGNNSLVRGLAFVDLGDLDYSDTSHSFESKTKANQYGGELGYFDGPFKLGTTVRMTSVDLDSRALPKETYWGLRASRSFVISEASRWKVSPTLQTQHLSAYGLHPAASLSLSGVLGDGVLPDSHTEVGYVPKFPTLLSRYSNEVWYHGNPDLLPERVFYFKERFQNEFGANSLATELYAQLRLDTQNLAPPTPINEGSSKALSWLNQVDRDFGSGISAGESFTLSYSKVATSGFAISYLPWAISKTRVSVQDPSARQRWRSQLLYTLSSSREYHTSTTSNLILPGYATLDWLASINLYADQPSSLEWVGSRIDLNFGVDDLFNQNPQIVYDVLGAGRVFRVALSGRF